MELSESAGARVKRAGAVSARIPADWRERFAAAFDAELQAWIDAVASGGTTGPSAWDGYAATVCCDAGLAALRSGAREPVVLRDMPDLYKATRTAASSYRAPEFSRQLSEPFQTDPKGTS